MYSVLYANGCSMTEGSELGNKKFNYDESKFSPNISRTFNVPSPEHIEHMMTHNYSFIAKELLGIPNIVNDAEGGGSNSRIVRTTILGVNNLLKTHKPEEILVVVGWTTVDRFEYMMYDRYAQFIPGHIKHTTLPSGFVRLAKLHAEWASTDLLHCMTSHLMGILHLKNYLESVGVDYVFSYGLSNHLEHSFEESDIKKIQDNDQLKDLYEMVMNDRWFFNEWYQGRVEDYKTFIDFFSRISFYSHSIDHGFKQGTGLHPLEDAHYSWGKTLHNFVKEKLNVEVL